jgi:hypothetical protein
LYHWVYELPVLLWRTFKSTRLLRPPGARYNKVRELIEARGIKIVDRGYELYDYEVARASRGSQATDVCGISHFSEAHKIYGSEVVASCLIHELGHCHQFSQGRNTPPGRQEKIEYEVQANQLGFDLVTPLGLVPADYKRHRTFFLKSYLDAEGWTRGKTLSEWAVFRLTLNATPFPG